MANADNKLNEIIDYYDQTEFDYKLAWHKKENPALHFGYYEKGAAESHYDALNQTNIVLARNASVKTGDRILDAGCGLGGSVFWLAQNFDVDVVGISLSEKQIQGCIERIKQFKLKGTVDFQAADFSNTSFPDQSFDVVWACESSCHAYHKIDFYKEAFRVLKPGGRLVVGDYIRSTRPLSEADEILLRNKWLANWAIDDLDTEEEHQDNLKQAGFDQIKIKNINDKVSVSLRNLHEKCTRSYPMERILNFFRIRSNVQHGNLVGSINQYKAFQKGLWWYTIISGEKGE